MIQYLKKGLGRNMNNLIAFVNEFLSYLLVMVIIVALCGVAIFIGTTLRKRKDKQEAEAAKEAPYCRTANREHSEFVRTR